MNGKFILIAGSAGRSCPSDKLGTAVQFVQRFTSEVLKRGGGVTLLAGGEVSTKDEYGSPHIFDWTALREVDQYANSTTETPRVYARLVMSDEAPEAKIDDSNLQILRNLEQRNVVEQSHIRREMFTGGEYRKMMIEQADAMLVIGGGKGTYSTGVEMVALAKPVLPLDLQLGSFADDGTGGVDLYREMMSEPDRFFPNTHPNLTNRLGLLSLERGINDTEAAARTAAEMLDNELVAVRSESWLTKFIGQFATWWRFVKVLPPIASAIKVVEFLRGFLP